jgi:hypothetical protein
VIEPCIEKNEAETLLSISQIILFDIINAEAGCKFGLHYKFELQLQFFQEGTRLSVKCKQPFSNFFAAVSQLQEATTVVVEVLR